MRGCGDCFDDRQEPDHDLRTEERWHLRGRVQDADGEVLAISIPRTEANVIRHFQERTLQPIEHTISQLFVSDDQHI